MKVCPKCQLEVEDKYIFCNKCGEKLEEKIDLLFCPYCGKKVETTGDFCPYCGGVFDKKPAVKSISNSFQSASVTDEIFNYKTNYDVTQNRNKTGIVIASIVTIIAIIGFFVFGDSFMGKELPAAEDDGQIALAFAKSNDKWGMIDKKGNWFIKPEYLSIGKFSEGLAQALDPVSKKWGFIDKNGKWIIKPQFYVSQSDLEEVGKLPERWAHFYDYQAMNLDSTGGGFREGFACVKLADNNYAYVDKKGKIIASGFEGASAFEKGYARVIVKKTTGLDYHITAIIDKNGQYAIKPVKGFIHSINDGFFRIVTENATGFMKPYDTSFCSPVYNSAWDFSEGLALVNNDGNLCIIDKNFKVIRDLMYIPAIRRAAVNKLGVGSAPCFDNGKLRIELHERLGRNLLGDVIEIVTVDRNGDVIPNEPKKRKGNDNADNDELILKREAFMNYGYTDKSGKYVIQPQFELASRFVDGVAVVRKNKKYGIIDMNGNYIKELSDNVVLPNTCGVIVAGWDGKMGVLDSTGKNVVIPNKFEAIYRFKKYKKQDLEIFDK